MNIQDYEALFLETFHKDPDAEECHNLVGLHVINGGFEWAEDVSKKTVTVNTEVGFLDVSFKEAVRRLKRTQKQIVTLELFYYHLEPVTALNFDISGVELQLFTEDQQLFFELKVKHPSGHWFSLPFSSMEFL
ncbi:MAG: hypothetical protein U9N57_01345 [Pseudomonadota bacterium]|nr:hypothetical protein [Pseudomonadota bacterium]